MTTTTSSLVEKARQLRPLVTDLADRIEAERRIPEELLAHMRDADMFNMFLPRELGGPELDPWSAFEVTEQLAMADASVGWCAMIASVSSWTTAFLPPNASATIYDTSNTILAGSVLGKPEACVVEGGFTLSGRFQFASGCRHSNWLGAVLPDPRLEGESPQPRILAFMPAEKCQIVDNWFPTGLRGTGSSDWTTVNTFIPWDFAIRFMPTKDTPRFAEGPLYREVVYGLTTVAHAGVQVGAARGAIDGYLERIQERTRRGVGLKQEPRVQAAVGEADALVRAGRAGFKEAVTEVWQTVVDGGSPSIEQRARLLSSRTQALWGAIQAVDLLYETMGSEALMQGNPVERRFRDVHASTAHLMSSKQGFDVAGAVLLGVDPGFTPLLS